MNAHDDLWHGACWMKPRRECGEGVEGNVSINSIRLRVRRDEHARCYHSITEQFNTMFFSVEGPVSSKLG